MKKAELFVGIDVSNKTLDVCKLSSTREFLKITNSQKSIAKFIKDLERRHTPSTIFLCLENTGKYSWRLVEALATSEINTYVVNPLHLKRSLGLIRGKNDKVDAVRIAQFIKKNHEELVPYVPEREEITSIKILLAERRYKVKTRRQLKAKNKDLKQVPNRTMVKTLINENNQLIKQYDKQIKRIETEIRAVINADQSLKQMAKLLKSVPGLGDIIAWNIIVKTNEFKTIKDPRKLACYCGVAPFQNRSGTSIFGKTRVSLLADKKLKKILHLGAMRAVRMNNDFKVYYERKVKEGKNKMLVLNAVRNKMIHVAYALINKQEFYQNRLVLS